MHEQQKHQWRRVWLIWNPTAGLSRRERIDEAYLRSLVERALTPEALVVKGTMARGGGGDVARQALEAGAELIIVAGGDGTLNEVAQVLADRQAVLGVLPLGTENLMASALEVPSRIEDAAQLLARGVVHRIDLGEVNGRLFMLMAGIGFDADAVRAVSSKMKRMVGGLAYILAGVLTLLRLRIRRLRIQMQHGTLAITSALLVIGNAKPFGKSQIYITHRARMDDGFLDLCSFRQRSLWDFIVHMVKVLLGLHEGDRQVIYLQVNQPFTVTSTPRAWIQVDGDVIGKTPAQCRIRPQALSVMVPEDWSQFQEEASTSDA